MLFRVLKGRSRSVDWLLSVTCACVAPVHGRVGDPAEPELTEGLQRRLPARLQLADTQRYSIGLSGGRSERGGSRAAAVAGSEPGPVFPISVSSSSIHPSSRLPSPGLINISSTLILPLSHAQKH